MYVDALELRMRIKQSPKTSTEIASLVGFGRATLYRKLKKGGDCFTIEELGKLSAILHLSPEEASSIFKFHTANLNLPTKEES